MHLNLTVMSLYAPLCGKVFHPHSDSILIPCLTNRTYSPDKGTIRRGEKTGQVFASASILIRKLMTCPSRLLITNPLRLKKRYLLQNYKI